MVWIFHAIQGCMDQPLFFSRMQKNKGKLKFYSNFIPANYVTETQNGYSSFFLFLLCSSLIGTKTHSTNLPEFHLPLSLMHTLPIPSRIKTGIQSLSVIIHLSIMLKEPIQINK